MAYRDDLTKTVFGDLRERPEQVYKVQTESSTYFVAFHKDRDRRYVIVRGAAGGDREHVVVRDSEPRVGSRSMFDVPVDEWIGQSMEVATVRTTRIVSVSSVSPTVPIPGGKGVALAAGGLVSTPGMAPGMAHGTRIGSGNIAHQVVVAQNAVPYPERTIRHAEDAAAMLRSVARRGRLFDDIAGDPAMRARLDRSLADCAALLEQIRKLAK